MDIQGKKALLISRYILDCKPYKNIGTTTTWEWCNLRPWLNSIFLEKAFSDDEQKQILNTIVENDESQGNSDWSREGGNNTEDQIFLLSYREVEKYFETDPERICEATAYAIAHGVRGYYEGGYRWWLRSPGTQANTRAAEVRSDGVISHETVNGIHDGVRPVFWMNLEDAAAISTRTQESEIDKLGDFKTVSSVVTFGHYEQDGNFDNGPEPIEWIVLDLQGEKALLLSKKILRQMRFNLTETEVTWETCTLREWLNKDFFKEAFNQTEQKYIVLSENDNSKKQGNPNYPSKYGNDTTDSVFLLSYAEVFKYIPETERRICEITDYSHLKFCLDNPDLPNLPNIIKGPCSWWTRSTGAGFKYTCTIESDGRDRQWGVHYIGIGVRPAIWVTVDRESEEMLVRDNR